MWMGGGAGGGFFGFGYLWERVVSRRAETFSRVAVGRMPWPRFRMWEREGDIAERRVLVASRT